MRTLFRLLILSLFTTASALVPVDTSFAAGISATGGGTFTTGQQFTVTVTATGDSFDSVQGTISVKGPASVVSFNAGGATWLPGKAPKNGGEFVGITSATNSLLIAKITLKGTEPGSGSVQVSGVKLARSGTLVGTSGSAASFTIQRALTPPSAVKVSSSTHPDQGQAYEATTADLAWTKDSGVLEFAYSFDQAAGTTPPATTTSVNTSASYPNLAIGTYYFHIRARNNDGWGSTSHYKIMVKEPDPKINESLAKPTFSGIDTATTYTTNLDDGTLTGIEITGTSEPGYTLIPTFTPALTVPEGKDLKATVDPQGKWKILLDFPVRSGLYQLTVQGLKDKTLTPVSDPLKFEVSIASQGSVRAITEKDAITPTSAVTPTPTPAANTTSGLRRIAAAVADRGPVQVALFGLAGIALIALAAWGVIVRRRKAKDSVPL